ncbi:hypothetical protein PFISCL1PPCAC_1001, partial [Pristionchus fissidentatus]
SMLSVLSTPQGRPPRAGGAARQPLRTDSRTEGLPGYLAPTISSAAREAQIQRQSAERAAAAASSTSFAMTPRVNLSMSGTWRGGSTIRAAAAAPAALAGSAAGLRQTDAARPVLLARRQQSGATLAPLSAVNTPTRRPPSGPTSVRNVRFTPNRLNMRTESATVSAAFQPDVTADEHAAAAASMVAATPAAAEPVVVDASAPWTPSVALRRTIAQQARRQPGVAILAPIMRRPTATEEPHTGRAEVVLAAESAAAAASMVATAAATAAPAPLDETLPEELPEVEEPMTPRRSARLVLIRRAAAARRELVLQI